MMKLVPGKFFRRLRKNIRPAPEAVSESSPQLRMQTKTFAGHTVQLNPRWKHEFKYAEFIESGALHGPLAMDLWVYSQLVHPGNRVLDAGANIGFTALLANLAGATEIHGFEPDPRLTDQLGTNTGHVPGMHIHPMALGEKTGQLDLRISQSHNQGSTFSETLPQLFPTVFENSQLVPVEVETVDNLFSGKQLHFWKIDVEGSEIELLRGAQRCLHEHRPEFVYIELYDDYFGAADEILKAHFRSCWRVVCRDDGTGRLVRPDMDLSTLQRPDLMANPPSFIYTNQDCSRWTDSWTRSHLMDRRNDSAA